MKRAIKRAVKRAMNRYARKAATAVVLATGSLLSVGAATATEAAKEPPTTQSAPSTRPAASPLATLAPYVGHEYQIDAAWADGSKLTARSTWEWGPGKKFIVCKVFVKDPKVGEYQRYESLFGEQDGKLTQWSFAFDGHARSAPWVLEGSAGTDEWAVPTPGGEARLRQTTTFDGGESYRWQVWMQAGGADKPWAQIMDGEWKKAK